MNKVSISQSYKGLETTDDQDGNGFLAMIVAPIKDGKMDIIQIVVVFRKPIQVMEKI